MYQTYHVIVVTTDMLRSSTQCLAGVSHTYLIVCPVLHLVILMCFENNFVHMLL
jgi:hypothetical protein